MHLKDQQGLSQSAPQMVLGYLAGSELEKNNLISIEHQIQKPSDVIKTEIKPSSSNNNLQTHSIQELEEEIEEEERNGNISSSICQSFENSKVLSSALSLLDISESDSCASDQLQHFSISSADSVLGNPVSESCSLASLENDESDFESYCSFETDFKNDLKHIRAGCDSGCSSGYDSLSVGYLSRPSSSITRLNSSSQSDITSPSHLSPDKLLDLSNNNFNQAGTQGVEVKTFYNKPKVYFTTGIGDKNGNGIQLKYSDGRNCFRRINSADVNCDSDDENPIDIEHRLAETIVKMNDAILSNGREEIDLQNQKLKQFHRENVIHENVIPEALVEAVNFNNQNNTDTNINNNNINFKNHQSSLHDLNLKLVNDTEDNRYSSPVQESPIVDAYEKECLDVPEKMVRELEKENPSKEDTPTPDEDTEDETSMPKQGKFEFGRKESEEKEDLDHEKDTEECNSEADDEFKIIKEPKRIPKPSLTKFSDQRKIRHLTFSVQDGPCVRRRHSPIRRRDRATFRRSLPIIGAPPSSRSKLSSPELGEFDVYNMETALPKIDWDAFEAHLNATKEEEKRKNDREEIRRKLAMGVDEEMPFEKTNRKPSLQSRLQSGMNLQICFMNETASDCESQCSDTESTQDRSGDDGEIFMGKQNKPDAADLETADFFDQQAQLQAEARLALAQAKEMARMQMEIEKQSKKKSPIADIVRDSFNKVGFPCPDKRRMSRQILTDMNVAQLQVIVNDFHTQIEFFNEKLVKYLLERDDLHMEQDSMLVDIEDLTKHLSAREKIYRSQKEKNSSSPEDTKTCLGNPLTSKHKSSKLKGFIVK